MAHSSGHRVKMGPMIPPEETRSDLTNSLRNCDKHRGPEHTKCAFRICGKFYLSGNESYTDICNLSLLCLKFTMTPAALAGDKLVYVVDSIY